MHKTPDYHTMHAFADFLSICSYVIHLLHFDVS